MDGIETFDLKTPVADSVIELFDTMLSMEVEFSDDVPQSTSDGQRITGSLSLAGKLMGGINIQVSETFARLMTAAMLGMEEGEIEGQEEINDVILEVCNIIGGNLKSGLNDSGLSCVISTPSITSGNDFQIETLNMERYERFAFRHEGNDIIVEVCIKAADDVEPEAKRQLTSIDLNKFKRLDIIA
ncbi:MAG: chemotaxis protein CheX, partial [Deltaproteobacteria bacterium]|nr:chemotaxis protein CheX [Deltaproteobacteria bacterium]